jgi:hypothetical protein
VRKVTNKAANEAVDRLKDPEQKAVLQAAHTSYEVSLRRVNKEHAKIKEDLGKLSRWALVRLRRYVGVVGVRPLYVRVNLSTGYVERPSVDGDFAVHVEAGLFQQVKLTFFCGDVSQMDEKLRRVGAWLRDSPYTWWK